MIEFIIIVVLITIALALDHWVRCPSRRCPCGKRVRVTPGRRLPGGGERMPFAECKGCGFSPRIRDLKNMTDAQWWSEWERK